MANPYESAKGCRLREAARVSHKDDQLLFRVVWFYAPALDSPASLNPRHSRRCFKLFMNNGAASRAELEPVKDKIAKSFARVALVPAIKVREVYIVIG